MKNEKSWYKKKKKKKKKKKNGSKTIKGIELRRKEERSSLTDQETGEPTVNEVRLQEGIERKENSQVGN